MKKLTYIFLLIWNIGIGQTFNDSFLLNQGSTTLEYIDFSDSAGMWTSQKITSVKVMNSDIFKYDTVKAVLMVSDSADEVITNVFRNGEETKIGRIRYSDTYFYWLYGYVIIQCEFCMIECPDGMPGCLVAHYGYGNKKTIGYLDSSKQPFSKDYIIWDYKIVQERKSW